MDSIDGIKTWQAVVTDLGYIFSVTFLAHQGIISGDAVLVALGVVGGAMGARRLARKKGQTLPPGAVTGLFTGITPSSEAKS